MWLWDQRRSRTLGAADVAQDYVDPDLRKLHVLSQIPGGAI